jgi:hypothetical protein
MQTGTRRQIFADSSTLHPMVSCITLRDKQLKRNKTWNRLGILCSSEPETILIQPNASIAIKGYIDQALDYNQTFAMT